MADNTSRHPAESSKGYQFGTFKGVFMPSILTILGVIMYLRLGWVLGNVGLPKTLLIVTMSSMITFLTGLSLSALATNRKIEGGGAYFIISRSLGVEAGAAVGLPLFFAQALGISFYATGFSLAVLREAPDLIPRLCALLHLSDGATALATAHDVQIIGVITLVALTVVAYISADLALKAQTFIMIVIGLSLASFFLGKSPALAPVAATLPEPASFWTVFAVFFPAVTGIEAGLAMSGDLRSPDKALPRGTLAAVLVGYAVYMLIPLFLSYKIADPSVLRLESMDMVMRLVARFGWLIVAGVCCAALSSALGALLGAPRTLQALARDRVVPRIFGRGFGKGNDPRFATATAFAVGLAGILLGNLNALANVLTMFFLTSYGLLNISAALEELMSPPSWRPKFRVAWPVCLVGALGCFAAMFMINAGATFMAAAVAITVFLLMERRSLKTWWGDMRSGLLMLIARNAIHALAKRPPDERTWQPNILVLCGAPTARWHLVELAGAISQKRGLMTVAAVLPEDTTADRVAQLEQTISDYLEKHDVPAIVRMYPAEDPLSGAEMLVKTYGYGPITPNTILIGETKQPKNFEGFARLIRAINHRRQNLVIIREREEPRPSGRAARIDVWWYGTQQNLGLMLALVHLLRQSPAWRDSELVLKSIVNDGAERADARKRLDSFIEKVRLEARAEILVKEESTDIFGTIRQHSQGADLVFLGVRAPGADESIPDYSRYYGELIKQVKGLPPTALVLAAEDINFYSIFEDL